MFGAINVCGIKHFQNNEVKSTGPSKSVWWLDKTDGDSSFRGDIGNLVTSGFKKTHWFTLYNYKIL